MSLWQSPTARASRVQIESARKALAGELHEGGNELWLYVVLSPDPTPLGDLIEALDHMVQQALPDTSAAGHADAALSAAGLVGSGIGAVARLNGGGPQSPLSGTTQSKRPPSSITKSARLRAAPPDRRSHSWKSTFISRF